MTVLVDTGVLYADHDTNATSVVLVERHDLDGTLSFDDDFDGLVRRFEPGTV